MRKLKIAYRLILKNKSYLLTVKTTIQELGYGASFVLLDKETGNIESVDYDILILEPTMSEWKWLGYLLFSRRNNPHIPVVLFSPNITVNAECYSLASDSSVFLVKDGKSLKDNFHFVLGILGLSKNHILFVDDDVNILKSYHRSMRKTPWQITTVSSAEKALKILSSEKVDMIVTDIKMPEMHGFELITKIREKNEKLPIIVCSAYQGMKENADLHFHNVAAFFEKPVHIDMLEEKIQAILNGSTRKNEIQSR